MGHEGGKGFQCLLGAVHQRFGTDDADGDDGISGGGKGSTIVILLILRLGSVMDTGFEQIFLMLNPFTMEVGNVLDTYVYFKGIQQGDISFATAVGLFKGAVGLILVVIANRLAKRFGEGGIY